MQLTLAELTVKLHKGSLPAAWRHVVKHEWPWFIDPVRGVVIDAPIGRAIKEDWNGAVTWKIVYD
jgi:hypothetical protein